MKTTAPLTKTQYGLYVECMEHQSEACYNIPYLYTFDGSLDEQRLCQAIETAVMAHPTLFTRIELGDDGEPVQTIDDSEVSGFKVQISSCTDIETEKSKFVQPFHIVGDRLFRLQMLKDGKHYYLLQDIHHIISDGESRKVLLACIEKAYKGEPLQPEEKTMAEVAMAEDVRSKSADFEADKKWYADHFDCGDVYSPLLGDKLAEENKANGEAKLTRQMMVEVAEVEVYCKNHGIYKSTFFTAAYGYLLAKYNNEQQALFSTIHNGRADKQLAQSVAMLVRTLPVYVKWDDKTTVLDFLKAGQEQMSGCRQHEAYSYSDVVNNLGLQMATMFAWHGTLFDKQSFAGLPMQVKRLNNNTLEVAIYVKAYIQDGKYVVEAEYNPSEYSDMLVAQFLESYEGVVGGMLTQSLLHDVEITTAEQTARLDSFNPQGTDYDTTETVVSLFRKQAKANPEAVAVVFKDHRYTYAQVDDISDRIACCIASKGLGREDAVSVLINRSEWMAIASMGILKADCAYQPLDPTYPKERLNFMVKDTGARLLIADEELCDLLDEYDGDVLLTKDIAQLPMIIDQLPEGPKPESLFILLYTSGSTGIPKGCQLTHANLVCYCHWYWKYYDIKPEHNVAEYASYGFDVHQEGIYPPLTGGATVHIIPEELRLDLVSLNEYLEREHITHTFMTTQVGYQFATNIENHSLLHLSVAGEKLAPLTPPKGYKLHNDYGPTESTIIVTAFEVNQKYTDIPIGKPLENVRTYVTDTYGRRLPVGALGELWLSGPQVARGYLNRPEKQAEVFIANPFTDEKKWSPVYRTGDIVRYLPDGNIQFIGRRDGQVKIRGFRIELKEVEAVIREYPGIKDATVQAFDEEGGGKFIAAYIVSDEQVDIEALNSFILDQKPPYMVPAVTMQIDAIPLNQNQKVNKKALPVPEKKTVAIEESNVPMNVLEQELHEMIANILNNKDFGVTTVLGYAGLTSISAIKLAVQVQKRYNVALDAKALVKTGTLQSIENEIWRSLIDNDRSKTVDVQPQPSASDHLTSVPLSYAQTGVYFDCLKNPSTTLYNIPYRIGFPQGTDAQALADALKELIKRHPQLTAHFGNDGSDIVQTVDLEQVVEIPQKQMSEEQLSQYKHDFVRPFDLSTGPLYRFEIVTTEKQVCLLADVHHLVFDGGSFDLFYSQLCSLMNGDAIEEEDQNYAAYVIAEKNHEHGEEYNAAKEFFKNRLAKVEAATEVQPDLENPTKGTISTARAQFDMEVVDNFCRTNNITPAHLTLCAVYYVLSRFANNDQLCITTVSGGRSNLKIRNTVGMFVNTLALSAHIGQQKVKEFLQEVSNNFDETLRHENYPFAQIAADYGLTAEIQFVYQLGVMSQYVCQGAPLELENLELNVPKFPITFFIKNYEGKPTICVEYDNGKYSARLMQSLADGIRVVIERMIAAPDNALTSISIVDDEEAERIIKIGTGKDLEVDLSKTFANLFTEQAKRTPDAPAVVDRDSQLTYGEMDRYSNALAHQLIDFGVKPNDFVCVMLDRFKEFPLSVLAIHKAGAAYTPLDFEYPNERLSYMLENSESKVLITSHDVLKAKQAEGDFSTAAAKTFFIDDFMADVPDAEPIDLSNPDGLAYMIYTSGSTGKPKGAMLHQAGLRNFIAVIIDMEQLTAADRISGHRSFSFDAHIEDMYPVLTLGGSFHIMPTEIRKDLALIRQFLIDHQITGGGYSTAMTCLLLNAFDDLPIRFTTGGGEKMSGVYSDHIEIINVYGPTECTDDTSYFAIKPGQRIDNIPIGESVANNWNFIVDTAGNLVPQGVAGELCFAGVQVGRGYWRLPERTAKSFVDCPFVKEDHWGRPVRMYHTGDLCRWNEDGQIEYLGRIDTQVKLRGFRIELGEIENKALNIEGVSQAAAEVRKVMGNEHLVLYYTLAERAAHSEEEIHQALAASSLADYMVPDVYMQLEVMPMTPNLKINRKALPTPELKRATEYVAPVGETEELFCNIFSEVLKIQEVGATDNFFEIGGTSINAIKVIVEASKQGVQIVFNDLFSQKTPRALATFVNGSETEETTTVPEVESATVSQVNDPYMPILSANTLDAFLQNKRQIIGDVLLTGATGYLGIHILKELLSHYDGRILCPIRAENDEKALNRLKSLYFYYFGTFNDFNEQRVKAFTAEVTNPDGLDKITQKGLTVINCVANVKHFSAGNDIEMVNIESVRHLIAFCLRTGSRLIHISTNSIAGMSVDGKPGPEVKLTEHTFNIGQDIDANKYVYSKYKAEELVLEAIAHHGLNAKIMRVGNLSARQKDGEFQINFNTNNFLARLRAYVVIGMVPYEDLDRRFEFSPIDEVASAIMLLAQTPKECIVFHPCNTHRQFLSDILMGFALSGLELRRVETEEFQQALGRMMENPDLVTLLRPLMAYNVSSKHTMRWIESTNDYTTQVLYRMGFQWPPTAADYVHRFVDTIMGFDYFTV
ncbi:MAG: amino acid adenylation domain-containing protein [Bacteroidales bacterium]|nr:amino acid adenylation domain-containing protein [Bacteroidales bacterium]